MSSSFLVASIAFLCTAVCPAAQDPSPAPGAQPSAPATGQDPKPATNPATPAPDLQESAQALEKRLDRVSDWVEAMRRGQQQQEQGRLQREQLMDQIAQDLSRARDLLATKEAKIEAMRTAASSQQAALQSEIERLQLQIGALEARNTTVAAQAATDLASVTNHRDALKAQLETADGKLRSSEAAHDQSVKGLRKRMASLEADLAGKTTELANGKQSRLAAQQTSEQQRQKLLDEQATAVAALTTERNEIMAAMQAQLTKQQKEAATAISDLEKQHAMERDAYALASKKTQAEHDAAIAAQRSDADARAQDLRKQVAALGERLAASQARGEDSSETAKATAKALKASRTAAADLQTQLQAATAQSAGLEASLQQAAKDNASLRQELTASQQQHAQSMTALRTDTDARAKGLRTHVAALKERLTASQERNDTNLGTASKMAKELEKTRGTVAELQALKRAADAQCAALDASLRQQAQESAALREEHNTVTQQLTQSKAANQGLAQQLADSTSSSEQLRTQLQSTRDRQASTSQQFSELTQQLRSRGAELAEAKAHGDGLAARLREMQTAMHKQKDRHEAIIAQLDEAILDDRELALRLQAQTRIAEAAHQELDRLAKELASMHDRAHKAEAATARMSHDREIERKELRQQLQAGHAAIEQLKKDLTQELQAVQEHNLVQAEQDAAMRTELQEAGARNQQLTERLDNIRRVMEGVAPANASGQRIGNGAPAGSGGNGNGGGGGVGGDMETELDGAVNILITGGEVTIQMLDGSPNMEVHGGTVKQADAKKAPQTKTDKPDRPKGKIN